MEKLADFARGGGVNISCGFAEGAGEQKKREHVQQDSNVHLFLMPLQIFMNYLKFFF